MQDKGELLLLPSTKEHDTQIQNNCFNKMDKCELLSLPSIAYHTESDNCDKYAIHIGKNSHQTKGV